MEEKLAKLTLMSDLVSLPTSQIQQKKDIPLKVGITGKLESIVTVFGK